MEIALLQRLASGRDGILLFMDDFDWSRYEGLFIDKASIAESINGDSLDFSNERASLLNQKFAIQYRDELISNSLGMLGVTRIVDVGCDFGSLLLAAQKVGIEALGIDPSSEAVSLCHNAGLAAIEGRYQDFSHDAIVRKRVEKFLWPAYPPPPKKGRGKRAIALLNILHTAPTNSPLWEWISGDLMGVDFLIVTAQRRQIEKLRNAGWRVRTKIGPHRKVLRLHEAHVLQYGRTFFTDGRALFSAVEEKLWRFFQGSFEFPDKIRVYTDLVVILERFPGPLTR